MKGFIYPLINVQDNKIFSVFQLSAQLRVIVFYNFTKRVLNNPDPSTVFITLLNTNASIDESQDIEVERSVQTLDRKQCPYQLPP